MKNELQLFLGEATERFCTWLFGVLDKLKETKNARRKAYETIRGHSINNQEIIFDQLLTKF